MSVDELVAEALKLDVSTRARLAERLLAGLEDLSEEENLRLWAEEAARRNADWNHNAGAAREAHDVFTDARARLMRSGSWL
jgi:broad specificity phosphatase PhoE